MLLALGAALMLTVSPTTAGRHDRVAVTITLPRSTSTRRSYVAEVHSVRPKSRCVNNRDRVFPVARAGTRVRASLDPARGEGGEFGWCPGRYRGTVAYGERTVARFSFRVDG